MKRGGIAANIANLPALLHKYETRQTEEPLLFVVSICLYREACRFVRSPRCND